MKSFAAAPVTARTRRHSGRPGPGPVGPEPGSTLDQYARMLAAPSDIHEHLPTLKTYAAKCRHVTEFGVRAVVSTWAFLAARPSVLRSYDIDYHRNIEEVKRCARCDGIDFKFVRVDVHDPGCLIEPTDLLFIDTVHTCAALSIELHLHAARVSRYLIFHDTTTYGEVDEDDPAGPGLLPAIDTFLRANPRWVRDNVFTNNNGLTILRRIPE